MADVHFSEQQKTFQPFSWVKDPAKRCPDSAFATAVHDMALGLGLIMEILEDATLREDDADGTQLFDRCQLGKLSRFAIAVSDSLQSQAAQQLERINSCQRRCS